MPVRLKPIAPRLVDMIKVVFVFCISVVFLKNEYGSSLWRVQSLTYSFFHLETLSIFLPQFSAIDKL